MKTFTKSFDLEMAKSAARTCRNMGYDAYAVPVSVALGTGRVVVRGVCSGTVRASEACSLVENLIREENRGGVR